MRGLDIRKVALLLGITAALAGCAAPAQGPSVVSLMFSPPHTAVSEDAITARNVTGLQTISQHRAAIGPLFDARFSPTERRIATIGADRVLRIWDADTGRLLDELIDHRQAGRRLAYSPDGSRLVSAGRPTGRDVMVWDTWRGEPVGVLSLTGVLLSDVAWSPDSQRFALVSVGSTRVFIYDADGGDLTQRRPSSMWLWAADYSTSYLAVVNELGNTYVYEAADFTFRRELIYSPRVPGQDIAFSPDESLLAVCHQDGVVNIWQVGGDWDLQTSFQAHQSVPGQLNGCKDGEFTGSGDAYLTVGDDGYLRAWDPRTGDPIGELALGVPINTLDISADGEQIVLALADGSLHILGLPPAVASP